MKPNRLPPLPETTRPTTRSVESAHAELFAAIDKRHRAGKLEHLPRRWIFFFSWFALMCPDALEAWGLIDPIPGEKPLVRPRAATPITFVAGPTPLCEHEIAGDLLPGVDAGWHRCTVWRGHAGHHCTDHVPAVAESMKASGSAWPFWGVRWADDGVPEAIQLPGREMTADEVGDDRALATLSGNVAPPSVDEARADG